VSSERDNRQRAAARARLEREMAARAEAARRKRVLQARVGAGVAAVVVLGAVIWIIAAAAGGTSKTTTPTANNGCVWGDALAGQPTPEPDPSNSASASASSSASASPGASPTRSLPAGIKDVGTPPTNPPRSGYQVLTFETNLGDIKIQMDLSKTPCTAASMAYLAGKGFYDNAPCHRLVEQIFALQCGDPSGTGSGGVTYQVADENLPTGKLPAYHAGDVAMANIGSANTNGSQFFFIYDNSQLQGNYTLWGQVIQGEDIVKKVGGGGNDGAFEGNGQAGGGHPNIGLTFKKVTAGPVMTQPLPAETTSPAPALTATPTTTPSATPKAS
jgi:peptidyl-prolyl cis-trans isomerase B (cyclophilin B)